MHPPFVNRLERRANSSRPRFLNPFHPLPPFSYLIYFTGKGRAKGNRDGMEIFPSLDRNRKTTLFTRPSSRFLSRERRARPRPPVEDAGHVQHGAITRSFRFFHLLDPLLVSFQPNLNGKPSGRGTFFLLVFKTATRRKSSAGAQRSARRPD